MSIFERIRIRILKLLNSLGLCNLILEFEYDENLTINIDNIESVADESESLDFPQNYKMTIKKPSVQEYSKSSQQRMKKNKMITRLSAQASPPGRQVVINPSFNKSKTQNMGNIMGLSHKGPKEPSQVAESNDNLLFSDKTPVYSKDQVSVKVKSYSNYRTRKGSEDIALNQSSAGYYNSSFGNKLAQLASKADNKVMKPLKIDATLSLDQKYARHNVLSADYYSGTIIYESPSKKLHAEPYSGRIDQIHMLKPVQEDRHESLCDKSQSRRYEKIYEIFLKDFHA